jgi:hypothetical protein
MPTYKIKVPSFIIVEAEDEDEAIQIATAMISIGAIIKAEIEAPEVESIEEIGSEEIGIGW